jgi:deazaflavin-dependent oxidoreductase (nitroreductase family)
LSQYERPGWFDKNIQNPSMILANRLGMSIWGSRVLRVRGRTSGKWRLTPLAVLTCQGKQYVVSPRGDTQWVQNLRAAGVGELLLGREKRRFKPAEIAGDERIMVLRAYMKKFAVGPFFGGVNANSSDEDLRRIAPAHPVIRIDPA